MKVGFIHPTFPGGQGTGAAHSATQIVAYLRDQGHDITAYCQSEPKEHDHSIAGVELKTLQTDGFPYHSQTALNQTLINLADELDQFDIVHSYPTVAIPAMNKIAAATTAQTVVTLNAYAGVCPKSDLRYMDQEPCENNATHRCISCTIATSSGHADRSALYRAASRLGNLKVQRGSEPSELSIDSFQALSKHVKRKYSEFGYPDRRIDVIPNMVDERFLIDHSSDFSEPYELLYVGGLDHHKGVDKLPLLIKQLADQSECEYRLTIVGDGGRREALAQESQRLGVSHLIKFRGLLPNERLPAIYANHDLFVYPGEWDEPFGRVFLEAMGARTPVIGTDVGAVGEIIGNSGIVVEPTVTALTDGIISLEHSYDLKTLSKNAETEINQYKPDRIGRKFEQLYESLL